jgi:hypothetical protein
MNELDEIRNLLPEQAPPSAQLVAKVRDQLAHDPKPVPRRPRLLVPIAAALAVAAGAVAVVSLPGNNDVPATEQAAAPSGRDILLMAAQQAEAQGAETGRFWRTRVLNDWSTAAAPQRFVTETWLASTDRDKDWQGNRKLDANPPDAGEVHQLPKETQILPGVTARVGELPAESTALRAFLLEHWQHPSEEPRVTDEYLFASAVMLLAEVPATPQTRAAALRLIADLGGVENTGQVTDPLGRKGNGVTLTNTHEGVDAIAQIVIDPANGTVLSVRYSAVQKGTEVKAYYVAVLSAGWTDETPSVPSADVP